MASDALGNLLPKRSYRCFGGPLFSVVLAATDTMGLGGLSAKAISKKDSK